jgi:peptidoglycan hydrolase CwlO-like protein
MNWFSAEIVAGTLGILGTIILTAKQLGWVTFGKHPAIERRNCAKMCVEHEKIVAEAKTASVLAKATADSLSSDISELKEQIESLQEKGDQRQYNIEAEFRRLRELMGEIKGYVKGIHNSSMDS